VAAFDQLRVTCRRVVRLADREIVAIAAFHPLQTLVEFVVTAGIGMVRLRALQVSSEQAGNLNYSGGLLIAIKWRRWWKGGCALAIAEAVRIMLRDFNPWIEFPDARQNGLVARVFLRMRLRHRRRLCCRASGAVRFPRGARHSVKYGVVEVDQETVIFDQDSAHQ
jgi:hypothetical protein